MIPKTPRGIRNNNPGNIRKSQIDWIGEIDGSDESFETFDTMENGIRALGKLILNYDKKYGLRTIQGIIDRWAPPTENNTDAYVAAVAARVGVSASTELDLRNQHTLSKLVYAIICHENGEAAAAQFVSANALHQGVISAIG